jgi:hypothetical protein
MATKAIKRHRSESIIFFEELVGKRFTKETLEKTISEFYGCEVKVSDKTEIDEDEVLCDFNFIGNVTTEDVFVDFDIYYLKHRKPALDGSTLYVTEVSYEF